MSTALPHFFGSAGDVFLRGSHLIRGAGTQVSSCRSYCGVTHSPRIGWTSSGTHGKNRGFLKNHPKAGPYPTIFDGPRLWDYDPVAACCSGAFLMLHQSISIDFEAIFIRLSGQTKSIRQISPIRLDIPKQICVSSCLIRGVTAAARAPSARLPGLGYVRHPPRWSLPARTVGYFRDFNINIWRYTVYICICISIYINIHICIFIYIYMLPPTHTPFLPW